MTGDPFDTAGVRARVLAAWTASPARFREDANAEEDLALGAYRDRLVVELAQNGADAAARAGTPGRLLLSLAQHERDGTLQVANTGAPLDATGVEALSTLRASPKRGEPAAVGRFGVGFVAVRAVADEISVVSRTGGVGWSLSAARSAITELPGLAEESARRGRGLPVLRLPYPAAGGPAAGEPPPGFDTVVTARLRGPEEVQLVRGLLEEVDAALLLALPGLAEVTVEIDGSVRRELRAVREPGLVRLEERSGAAQTTTRWRTATAAGPLDAGLLADRPTEERDHPSWSLTWAVPVDEAGGPLRTGTAAVVHAPTPTGEPLDLPALLLGSFPLDSTRRFVAAGPLRDFLVRRAGALYADLAGDLARASGSPRVLDLVPGPVPTGPLDALVRQAALAALEQVPLLPAAGPGAAPLLRPRDATALPGADAPLLTVLAEVLPGLIDAAWARQPGHVAVLSRLGARVLALADAVDALAGLRREPGWWRQLYDTLLPAVAFGQAEALAALPVPLADGRLVRGPRGLLLPPLLSADDEAGDTALPPGLEALGLRVAHPGAAHPLLERLGAAPATAEVLLRDPALLAAVGDSLEAPDPDAVAAAVLGLVAAAGAAAELPPELADLALRDDEGDVAPAAELVLPDGPLAGVIEPGVLGVVDPDLVARWGADLLERVGVLRTFAVVRDADVVLDPAATAGHDLDAEDDYVASVLAELARPVPSRSSPSPDASGSSPPPYAVRSSPSPPPYVERSAPSPYRSRSPAAGAPLPPVLAELVAVRDLDLVRPDAWPAALALLARPPLRGAVTEPALVVRADGRREAMPAYTAWWLRRFALLAGRPLGELRDPQGDPLLQGLYDDAPPLDVDPATRAALGLRTTLAALVLDPDGPGDLLDRLADPLRPVASGQLRAIYRALAALEPDDVDPPGLVRVTSAVVADAADVVVLDAPDLAPLVTDRHVLAVPASIAAPLAGVLGLDLAGEVVDPQRPVGGVVRPVPAAVAAVLPGAPPAWIEHDELVVGGVDVEWRVADGQVHAATLDGLARGLAWAAGAWERRLLAAAVLADPGRLDELLAEAALDER